MTLFEFTFGLHSLILGLGLAQVASSLQGLAVAGRRVRWAAEPLLLTGFVLLTLVFVWLEFWDDRDIAIVELFPLLAHLAGVLLTYVAAGSALPHIPNALSDDMIDLHDWFRRSRIVSLGAMAGAALIATAREWVVGDEQPWQNLIAVALMLAAMFPAPRWVTTLLLATLLVFVVFALAGYRLEG